MKTLHSRFVAVAGIILLAFGALAIAQEPKPTTPPAPAAAPHVPARDYDKELAELQKQAEVVQMRMTQNYRALEHLEEFQQWLKDYQAANQLQAQASQLMQQKAAHAAEAKPK